MKSHGISNYLIAAVEFQGQGQFAADALLEFLALVRILYVLGCDQIRRCRTRIEQVNVRIRQVSQQVLAIELEQIGIVVCLLQDTGYEIRRFEGIAQGCQGLFD